MIPLAAIGGVALLLAERPSLAQQATDLAAIATPIAALGGLVAFRVRALALLTPVLYLIAWQGDGRPAQIATDLLIAGAAVSLAWLTGTVAPRGGLIVGILAATVVDVYQVVVSEQVQVASHALASRSPPPGCRVCRSSCGEPPRWDGATRTWRRCSASSSSPRRCASG